MTALDVLVACAAVAMFGFVVALLAALAQWSSGRRYDVRKRDE